MFLVIKKHLQGRKLFLYFYSVVDTCTGDPIHPFSFIFTHFYGTYEELFSSIL